MILRIDQIGTYETELASLTWEQIAKHVAKLAEEPGLLPPVTRKRVIRALAFRLLQTVSESAFLEGVPK